MDTKPENERYDGFDLEYTHERIKNPDGTSEHLMKNSKGVVVRKTIYNANNQPIEILDYDDNGKLETRTVLIYKEDWHTDAWKKIEYDANGNVTWSRERDVGPH
jgi:hypothetical protein